MREMKAKSFNNKIPKNRIMLKKAQIKFAKKNES